MKKLAVKKQTQTPFEQALSQAKAGTLQTPSVNYQGKNLDYFGEQSKKNSKKK